MTLEGHPALHQGGGRGAERGHRPVRAARSPPVLVTSEADGQPTHGGSTPISRPGRVRDAEALLTALVPSAAGDQSRWPERVGDEDWVTLSQQGLEPIRAGRFFVTRRPIAIAVPAGAIAFEIDAGRAFGTGQHETTTGCLVALDRAAKRAARASPISPISAPAPACSPSRRCGCGRRRGRSPPTSIRSRSR